MRDNSILTYLFQPQFYFLILKFELPHLLQILSYDAKYAERKCMEILQADPTSV